MSKEFFQRLNQINKSYFNFADLLKIWKGTPRSLRVVLSRMVKKGEIQRLKNKIYVLKDRPIEVEKIANALYLPSYLSFESALSIWGILSQIPYALTFATPLKSKKIVLDKRLIEYRRIKKELFFGFVLKDNLYIATPEKALLDTFYLASMGKLRINFKNLDYRKIDKKQLRKMLAKYPIKTRKLVEKFIC